MGIRIFVLAAFMANALLGSFCAMPMAMAADMPMNHDDAVMEMVMTPIIPMTQSLESDIMMSTIHCEQCAHVDRKKNVPDNGGCAGHCLAKAQDALLKVASISTATKIFVVVAPNFSAFVKHTDTSDQSAASLSPPINFVLERSVVMKE